MNKHLREQITEEVTEYLAANNTQQAVQEARTELRHHRLGRASQTTFEQEQVAVVYIADKLLRAALSDTLEENRKLQSNWRQGHKG